MASMRSRAASSAMRALTPAFGRTGVTMTISSRTASKTTMTVGRMKMASGVPMRSGLARGRRSISRTMS